MEGLAPGYPVNCVDTTGAGDAFFGAALAEIHQLGGLGALNASDASRIARFANAAGAICASRRGAIPAMPDRSEIEKLVQEAE